MALGISNLPKSADTVTKKAAAPKIARPRPRYRVAEWLETPTNRPFTELIEVVIQRMPNSLVSHSRIIGTSLMPWKIMSGKMNWGRWIARLMLLLMV